MTPEWIDLPASVYKSYGTPPIIPYAVSATTIGAVALDDNSAGLTNKFWGVGFEPISKEIRLWDAGTETVLHTETEDVTNISIAFTSDATVAVAYITASGALKLYWFSGTYIVSALDTGVSQVVITLDMKDNPSNPSSDVILTYLKSQAILTRVQNQSYAIVGTTPAASGAGLILQSGMSVAGRFQVTFESASVSSVLEAGIATDTIIALGNNIGTIVDEGLTSQEAHSAGSDTPASLSENTSASDVIIGGLAAIASAVESTTALDAITAGVRITKALIESLSAIDLVSATGSFNGSLGEASNATETETTNLGFEAAVLAAVTSSDLQSPAVIALVDVLEFASPLIFDGCTVDTAASSSEFAFPLVFQGTSADFFVAEQSAAATDSISSQLTSITGAIANAVDASDTIISGIISLNDIVEGSTATDSVSSSGVFSVSSSDLASALDSAINSSSFEVGTLEAVEASDIWTGFDAGLINVIEQSEAGDFFSVFLASDRDSISWIAIEGSSPYTMVESGDLIYVEHSDKLVSIGVRYADV